MIPPHEGVQQAHEHIFPYAFLEPSVRCQRSSVQHTINVCSRLHGRIRTNSPECVIPDLLSHLARPSGDILQELIRRHVLHAQKYLPYPRPKCRILSKQAPSQYQSQFTQPQQAQRTTADGIPSTRINRLSFRTESSTSWVVRTLVESLNWFNILLNECAAELAADEREDDEDDEGAITIWLVGSVEQCVGARM